MPEYVYRIAFLLLLVAMFVVAARFRGRADRIGGKVSRREDPLAVRVGLALTALPAFVVAILFVVHPAWIRWAELPVPDVVRTAAIGTGAVAIGVGAWILAALGRNVTPTAAVRADGQLVTHGPYRFVRHPLYTNGALLHVPSLGLLAANGILLFGGLAAIAVLVARTPLEERNLEARYGDAWRDYARRTGRFLPRL